MCSFSKTKRFFSFDRIVGYMTIAGSIATIYGVRKIDILTVELNPVMAIIQKEQSTNQRIIRDTITITRRDTVIRKDTVSLHLQKPTYPSIPKDEKWDRVNQMENDFRTKHQLPRTFN